MTDMLTKAVAKLENTPLDDLEALFGDNEIMALVAVRQEGRASYEKLLKRWKSAGWSRWHELDREVKRKAKQIELDAVASKPVSSETYFDRDIVAAAQYRITETRPRVDGIQVPHWKGIRLVGKLSQIADEECMD